MYSSTRAMQPGSVAAHKIPLGYPNDVSGLERLVREGRLRPDEVIAVVGKTQGSGDRFDSTRMDADSSLRRSLLDLGTRDGSEIERIPMVFSSGAVGLLEPNVVVFTRSAEAATDPAVGSGPRLVIGTAQTPPIPENELGHLPMVRAVERSARDAAAAAGIDPREADYALAKTCLPAVTDLRPVRADEAGYDDMETLLRASGATALGIGAAVGDIDRDIRERDIVANAGLWSGRVSTSTGHEHPETQIVLFGNRQGAGGTLRIGHAVMEDALDIGALSKAVRAAGLDVPDTHVPDELRKRIVAVFVKAGTPEATLRGRRQVQEDQNPHYIAQVKATVGGIFAAAVGDPALYISGAAVHQGPRGAGNLAVIVDHGEC